MTLICGNVWRQHCFQTNFIVLSGCINYVDTCFVGVSGCMNHWKLFKPALFYCHIAWVLVPTPFANSLYWTFRMYECWYLLFMYFRVCWHSWLLVSRGVTKRPLWKACWCLGMWLVSIRTEVTLLEQLILTLIVREYNLRTVALSFSEHRDTILKWSVIRGTKKVSLRYFSYS